MKLVLISDTHERHYALDGFMPEADVLVHAGDFSMMGEPFYVEKFNEWLGEQKSRYKHIVVIPGNHELTFDEEKSPKYLEYRALITNAILLVNDSCVIDGVKFYGMPDTPEFFNWAFNRERGEEMKQYTAKIPDDTDVLITHGPPYGVLDTTWRVEKDPKDRSILRRYQEHVGCQELLLAVERVKPKVHVFGHIHGAYGAQEINGTKFFNASICDERYRPTHEPYVVEI